MAAKKTKKNELTPLQKRFCREYLVDLNATQAYVRAGYKARGKAIRTNASRLLAHAGVQAELARRGRAITQRAEIKAEDVVQELVRLGFVNLSDVADYQDGELVIRDMADWTERGLAAVAEIVQTETLTRQDKQEHLVKRTTRIKLHDKARALADLGKYFHLFNGGGAQEDRPLIDFKLLVQFIQAAGDPVNPHINLTGKDAPDEVPKPDP